MSRGLQRRPAHTPHRRSNRTGSVGPLSYALIVDGRTARGGGEGGFESGGEVGAFVVARAKVVHHPRGRARARAAHWRRPARTRRTTRRARRAKARPPPPHTTRASRPWRTTCVCDGSGEARDPDLVRKGSEGKERPGVRRGEGTESDHSPQASKHTSGGGSKQREGAGGGQRAARSVQQRVAAAASREAPVSRAESDRSPFAAAAATAAAAARAHPAAARAGGRRRRRARRAARRIIENQRVALAAAVAAAAAAAAPGSLLLAPPAGCHSVARRASLPGDRRQAKGRTWWR